MSFTASIKINNVKPFSEVDFDYERSREGYVVVYISQRVLYSGQKRKKLKRVYFLGQLVFFKILTKGAILCSDG